MYSVLYESIPVIVSETEFEPRHLTVGGCNHQILGEPDEYPREKGPEKANGCADRSMVTEGPTSSEILESVHGLTGFIEFTGVFAVLLRIKLGTRIA